MSPNMGLLANQGRLAHLSVKLMRPTNLQIETIVTDGSPQHIESAANMIVLFQIRQAHIQSQLSSFEELIRKERSLLSEQVMSSSPCHQEHLLTRIEALEEITALASEHCYEPLVMEYALRDVVDEEESKAINGHVQKTQTEAREAVEAYGSGLWQLLIKGWPEVAAQRLEGFLEEVN